MALGRRGPASRFLENRMERAEPLNTDTEFEDRVDPRRRARQRSLAWPLVAIIALVVIIAAIVFAWRRMNPPEPAAPAAPSPQATAPAPAPPVDATPKHPIEAAA